MGWFGGGGGGSTPKSIEDQVNEYRTSRKEAYEKWEDAQAIHKGTTDNLDKFGLIYDQGNKSWNSEFREKTDHATIANSPLLEIKPTNLKEKELWVKWKRNYDTSYNEYYNARLEGKGEWHDVGSFSPPRHSKRSGWISLGTDPQPYLVVRKIIQEVKNQIGSRNNPFDSDYFDDNYGNSFWGSEYAMKKNWDAQKLENGKAAVDNEYNQKWNNVTNEINDANVILNNRTKGSDYLESRNAIQDKGIQILRNAGFTDEQIQKLGEKGHEEFKNFYRTEKLKKWSNKLAAPIPGPTGSKFDGDYYLGKSQAARDTWNEAVENDDIDITERYDNNPNVFALQHWTNQGRQAGLRAYAPEIAEAVDKYQEITTEDDIQKARDKQLGISDMETYKSNILSIPYIGQEWEKASSEEGDEYWKELGDKYNLDEKEAEQFIALFRLSEREADKDISFLHQINNPGYGGISELEDAVTEAAGDKARVDIEKFGALTKDVLKQTIAEIKDAKAKESFLGTIQGFPGYGEIMDVNESLSNSLLGDLDTGGYLSWMGGEKTKDQLEKSMERITGIKNNITYNWQKWYDDELKTQYESGGTFYTGEDDPETIEDERKKYEIDAEFGKAFIDKYLTKRFDQSKSMNEFVEYLDVRDSESNPFQTMSMLQALNEEAKQQAAHWQREMNQQLDNGQRSESFDSNFYLNPSAGEENIGKITKYAEQTEKIQQDLERAKNNPDQLIDENLPALGTWKQQLYKYGVDINDETKAANGLTVGENNFAKMHFDVVGQSKGFDGAEDFLNPSKIRAYVYEEILPNLEDEALKQDSVFGQFITPEEFADDMLEGIDPNLPESWQEVLNSMEDTGQIEDADNWEGTYEDLKEMIMEVMRTGSASEIRSNIKYLNENRKRPTQERLGSLYIERESDYKPETIEGETELFKTFQKAGFEGSEEDFYNDFFPDLNREDQKLLTIAGENKSIGSFMDSDFSDPFASFTQISEFLVDDEDNKEEEEEKKKQGTSFFSLDDEDENDWDYKKKKTESTFGSLSNLFNQD